MGLGLPVCLWAENASGRYAGYTEQAAKGPHAQVKAATFFGGDGYEEFTAAVGLPNDGGYIVAGNSWGPAFPLNTNVTVLGKGAHRGLSPTEWGKRAKNQAVNQPNSASPDCAGFLLFYDKDVKKIQKAYRFDWGVGTVMATALTEDGKSLLVTGRATAALGILSNTAKSFKTTPVGSGKYDYAGVSCPGDVYVMKLKLDDGKIEWIQVLAGLNATTDKLWIDKKGVIYLPAGGLYRITADGGSVKKISDLNGAEGPAKWVGFNPKTGESYFGGDRNTKTGREPYRQPYLYRIDSEGQRKARYWEPDPKEISSATGHMESDSSILALDFRSDGTAALLGWSDGGNSVLPRQISDWHVEGPGGGMKMATWGMKSANSLGHVMLANLDKPELLMHSWFACFIPGNFHDAKFRNAPNAIGFEHIVALPGDALLCQGGAATGLIQTPNAFYKYPEDGPKYGGEFALIFNPEVNRLLFSSYLPGCAEVRLGKYSKGGLVISRSKGDDASQNTNGPTPSPVTKGAVQEKFGGKTDGHLIILELP
jgi:hypothetical protein